MFSKFVKFALLIVFVILIVFGYEYINKKLNPPLVSDDFTYGNGRIESTQIAITPRISGRVLQSYVKEGDIVTKGQKLAKLDTRELDAKLMLAKAQIAQAKENKKHAQALLKQQKNQLKKAQKDYERAKNLYTKKAIAEAEFEEYETLYRSTLAATEAAKASVAQAEQAINVAKAQAQSIEVNIEDSTLYAPKKARVLYKLVQEYETVGAGQSVFILLDLLDTYMSIFVPTKEAGLIDYGDHARIVLDAIPDVAIPAKITFISPKAQFTPKQIETIDEREKLMFRVRATIDLELLKEHIDKVKTGLPGVVYIPLKSDVIWPDKLNNLPKSYTHRSK